MLPGHPDNEIKDLPARTGSHQGLLQLASVDFYLVNTRKAWTVYIVLRVLFFAVPFALLFWIGWPWWLALAVATLIALALSVIFLSKQRGAASASIYDWRMRDRTKDDIDEDTALDSTASRAASAPAATTSETPVTEALSHEAAAPEVSAEVPEKP